MRWMLAKLCACLQGSPRGQCLFPLRAHEKGTTMVQADVLRWLEEREHLAASTTQPPPCLFLPPRRHLVCMWGRKYVTSLSPSAVTGMTGDGGRVLTFNLPPLFVVVVGFPLPFTFAFFFYLWRLCVGATSSCCVRCWFLRVNAGPSLPRSLSHARAFSSRASSQVVRSFVSVCF